MPTFDGLLECSAQFDGSASYRRIIKLSSKYFPNDKYFEPIRYTFKIKTDYHYSSWLTGQLNLLGAAIQ
ncbi:hypothetical protein XENTR_v10014429 [Xenopus tropicalis]|nr:hypothetical protein XENTR_v10014429 [Xenopus tropicalis]